MKRFTQEAPKNGTDKPNLAKKIAFQNAKVVLLQQLKESTEHLGISSDILLEKNGPFRVILKIKRF